MGDSDMLNDLEYSYIDGLCPDSLSSCVDEVRLGSMSTSAFDINDEVYINGDLDIGLGLDVELIAGFPNILTFWWTMAET